MAIRIPVLAAVLGLFLLGSVAQAADTAPAPTPAPAKKSAKPAKSTLLKVGDTIYVCGCGPGCTCKPHVSAKPAQCGCKKDMVKVTVTKVAKGEVTVKHADGTEEVVKTPYACGCGPSCNCDSAALAPGKCSCGKPLVKSE